MISNSPHARKRRRKLHSFQARGFQRGLPPQRGFAAGEDVYRAAAAGTAIAELVNIDAASRTRRCARSVVALALHVSPAVPGK